MPFLTLCQFVSANTDVCSSGGRLAKSFISDSAHLSSQFYIYFYFSYLPYYSLKRLTSLLYVMFLILILFSLLFQLSFSTYFSICLCLLFLSFCRILLRNEVGSLSAFKLSDGFFGFRTIRPKNSFPIHRYFIEKRTALALTIKVAQKEREK